jgi:hypothetical protein
VRPVSWRQQGKLAGVPQQRQGVVPVRRASTRPGEMPYPSTRLDRFHALLPAIDRAGTGAFPAARRLGDAPVHGQVTQQAQALP